MKIQANKIQAIADKIISGESPRFTKSGKDMLVECLNKIQHLAATAYVNKESAEIINALVDHADKFEPIAWDFTLREKLRKFVKPSSYVPICVCDVCPSSCEACSEAD